jgi:hypothetical protein
VGKFAVKNVCSVGAHSEKTFIVHRSEDSSYILLKAIQYPKCAHCELSFKTEKDYLHHLFVCGGRDTQEFKRAYGEDTF